MRPQAGQLLLFAGNSNPSLAEKISHSLSLPLGKISVSRFKDGECSVQIEENVRGADVFLVQSTCRPVNENLVELLVMIDAFKRASAGRITAVIPYFGYARQDRKERPRVPITAKLVADIIDAAGADRVLTVDLHANQLQGFFNMPVDHLFASAVLLEPLRKMKREFVVVSPDAGGVERARALAKRLNNASLAIVDKRRERANVSQVMHIIGDVKGRDCLIFDDIIDTAGTLTQTAAALQEKGAVEVFAACSHGVLSDPADERIGASVLSKVFITDSIPPEQGKTYSNKLETVTLAGMLAEAIERIHEESSISSLFV